MPKSPVGPGLLASTSEWPKGWSYEEADLPLGQELVALMLPFLQGLVKEGLSETSLRRHFGNAALLGSEIIRRVQIYGREPGTSRELLLHQIGEDGGPLCRHIDTEQEQRSFDGTCRRLYRFLSANEEHTAARPGRKTRS
jgi:hypothetical protein